MTTRFGRFKTFGCRATLFNGYQKIKTSASVHWFLCVWAYVCGIKVGLHVHQRVLCIHTTSSRATLQNNFNALYFTKRYHENDRGIT